jgi:hypothetical protein
MTVSINDTQHIRKNCHNAGCRILFIAMLSVAMLGVAMLGVAMLSVVMPDGLTGYMM